MKISRNNIFAATIKTLLSSLLMMGFFLSNSYGGVSIVVNKNSSLTQVDAEQVARVFLGKRNDINGVKLVPIEQIDSVIKKEFYQKILQKTEAQVKSYWARSVFSGQSIPPKEADENELHKLITTNNETIAYIDSSKVEASMKVILTVK